MAHGHHDTGLSWEWDSVLLLSNPGPLASSSFGVDGSNNSGQREHLDSAPGSSSDHRHHQHDSLHSNEASANHVHSDSRSSESQRKGRNGERSRDPRLDCPNFLAGRVPCACTDNDDDDSGVSRKRSKPVPRCQVAACGAALTDLKGYHQRHRVCLRCAHATRVILRDQPHRYCQQCGKFHPICDFDEGKRSCRRKLEKHNNRRRRKAGEDSLPSLDYGDTDTQNESSTADGTKFDLLSEVEPKEFVKEKPSLDAEENQTPGFSPNERLSVVVKVAETSDVPEIPLHTVEDSVAAGLKGNGSVPEPSPSCTEVSQCLDLEFGQEQPCSMAQQVPFAVEPLQESLQIMCPDDFSLHSSSHPEAGGARLRRGNDEESLLALLMEESGAPEDSRFSENAGEHLISNPAQLWESSTSPRRLSKEVAYSSPLPTGRISFKLYDWNPGDFPRQLRQQVMEWLSNMPVDLEGYIRSGCTILTIFIAMPQPGWDRLSADWTGSVLKLVKAEQSLFRFWSSGYLIARMDDQKVHIHNVWQWDSKLALKRVDTWELNWTKVRDVDADIHSLLVATGELAHPLSESISEIPVLDRVRPLCLEVGGDEEVVIIGHNFQQPHSRLLVSFDGKYIVNDAYESRMQGGGEGAVTRSHIADTDEDAMLFVKMPALLSKRSGTAYIEIEHMSGTSNYIPLLVADKNIVDEVRSLEMEMDMPSSCCSPNIDGNTGFPYLSQQRAHSLLLDLGWVLKNVSLKSLESEFQLENLELQSERLRSLLFFGVKRSWCNVVQRVLELANKVGLMEKIGVLENGFTAVQVAVLHQKVVMVEHLTSCADSLCAQSSQSKFWWNLGFPGPKGLTALHMVALQPGAHSLRDTLLKKRGVTSMWNGIQDDLGQTAQDYCTHGRDMSYRIKRSDSSSRTESTTKAEDPAIILHDLQEVQCNDIVLSRLKGETRILVPSLLYQGGPWTVAPISTTGLSQGRGIFAGLRMYISRGRKRNYQLLSSVTLLLFCVGLCAILQRPNEVVLLSLNLQRSLWGLEDGSQ